MPVPPGEIGLHCRHHLAALWWLGLLYRRPVQFKAALAGLRPAAQLTAVGCCVCPTCPTWCWLRPWAGWSCSASSGWRWRQGWRPILLVHAAAIARGIAGGIAFGIAWSVGSLRAYYHLAHLLFLWPRPRGHWYPYHPVAWDDLCVLPFPQLDLLLTAYAEQHPQAGEQEIERLIVAYPAQRMAALRDRRPLRAAGKRVSGHSATLIGAGARPARRDPSQAGTVPGPPGLPRRGPGGAQPRGIRAAHPGGRSARPPAHPRHRLPRAHPLWTPTHGQIHRVA